ncbi:hypothetical protein QBC41DRAFT_104172 [Cercophora samala]|uniref:Uncharacterized protein n=1 Tax=Cercophora samala TaxID=330535 RepID=A0AA39ZMP1_9PEZI|nr:hypothetical protein QBC41DRAFT_104172 [Cercophora samala]
MAPSWNRYIVGCRDTVFGQAHPWRHHWYGCDKGMALCRILHRSDKPISIASRQGMLSVYHGALPSWNAFISAVIDGPRSTNEIIAQCLAASRPQLLSSLVQFESDAPPSSRIRGRRARCSRLVIPTRFSGRPSVCISVHCLLHVGDTSTHGPFKQASASTHLVTPSNLFAPDVLLLGSFPGEVCDFFLFGFYAERCGKLFLDFGPQGPMFSRPLGALLPGRCSWPLFQEKGETSAAAGSTQEIEQSSVQDVAARVAVPQRWAMCGRTAVHFSFHSGSPRCPAPNPCLSQPPPARCRSWLSSKGRHPPTR